MIEVYALNSSIRISKAAGSFSRVEDGDKLLLVRPNGSRAPLVYLLKEPAGWLWQTIKGKKFVSEVMAEAVGAPYSMESLQAALSHFIDHGFITTEKPLFAEGRLQSSDFALAMDPWVYQFSAPALNKPLFLLWEITDNCPRREHCMYCYRPRTACPDPLPEQWRRIIEQIIASEIPFVTLLGGEPLCHPDVFEIIAGLRAHNIFVKMITNGLLLNRQVVARLSDAGLNQVAVSLDGLTAEEHERSRGPGSFEKAIQALQLVRSGSYRVSMSLTVSNFTLRQLAVLPAFCRSIGVEEVYISQLRAPVVGTFPAGLRPLQDDELIQLEQIVTYCNQQGTKVINLKECSCGRSSCVIHPDGRFSACPFGQSHFGNVLQEDLGLLWSKVVDVTHQTMPLRATGFCYRLFDEYLRSLSKDAAPL